MRDKTGFDEALQRAVPMVSVSMVGVLRRPFGKSHGPPDRNSHAPFSQSVKSNVVAATRGTNSQLKQPILEKNWKRHSPKYHEVVLKGTHNAPALFKVLRYTNIMNECKLKTSVGKKPTVQT